MGPAQSEESNSMASQQYDWAEEVEAPADEAPADDLDIADGIDEIFSLS